MLRRHEKIHSANGKRQILGLALERDYEVPYAEDGQEALDLIRLRMGVYARADKTIDAERRFDRTDRTMYLI